MDTLYRLLLFFLIASITHIDGTESTAFHATIPVVDMNDYNNPKTKQKFIDAVAKALHEVGFFAVINPGIDQEALDEAYSASYQFFQGALEEKNEIFAPHLHGQRGFFPSETAQGFKEKDYKEFVHIGKKGNLWPSWMELKDPMETLMRVLDHHSEALQRAMALAIGESEDFLVEMTREGECLLRLLYYPRNPAPGTYWAAKHTDIDLFTILPMATEEGLQIFHDGKWIDVKVPPNAFIVNGGDKLQNLTNGYFKSSLHQVVSKPDIERYSIVYFVHPRNEDCMDPTPSCIAMTGGVKRYPDATSFELLATRLRELGLAGPDLVQWEQECGIMDRIKELVESGNAAEPVKKTYMLWSGSQ